MPPPTLERC